MRRALFVLVLFASLLIGRTALAHKPSDAYLTLAVHGEVVTLRIDVALRDVDYALGLDADADGKIRWGEVKAKSDAIATWVSSHLELGAREARCPLHPQADLPKIATHSDGTYASLAFEARCERSYSSASGQGRVFERSAQAPLRVHYDLLFDLDPQHRGIVRVVSGSAETVYVLSASEREHVFEVTGEGDAAFTRFVQLGELHIWRGFDHVLFLLALLLPAVFVRVKGEYTPVAEFKPAAIDVLRIVTAFTVAHSITLTLAALDLVALPSRLVESAIAGSIVVAAANNLRPVVADGRWMVGFGLGLMHGFGFASSLTDLGLDRAHILSPLFGFNLGVELGQLAIVLVFLPLAYAWRKTRFYQRGILLAGSAAILLLASLWFVERAFAVAL